MIPSGRETAFGNGGKFGSAAGMAALRSKEPELRPPAQSKLHSIDYERKDNDLFSASSRRVASASKEGSRVLIPRSSSRVATPRRSGRASADGGALDGADMFSSAASAAAFAARHRHAADDCSAARSRRRWSRVASTSSFASPVRDIAVSTHTHTHKLNPAVYHC